MRPTDEDDESGRGLTLVDTLAGRWGVSERVDGKDGKSVWFTVALPDPAPATGAGCHVPTPAMAVAVDGFDAPEVFSHRSPPIPMRPTTTSTAAAWR